MKHITSTQFQRNVGAFMDKAREGEAICVKSYERRGVVFVSETEYQRMLRICLKVQQMELDHGRQSVQPERKDASNTDASGDAAIP